MQTLSRSVTYNKIWLLLIQCLSQPSRSIDITSTRHLVGVTTGTRSNRIVEISNCVRLAPVYKNTWIPTLQDLQCTIGVESRNLRLGWYWTKVSYVNS